MKNFKENLYLKGFSFFKVPALFFANPRVVELSDERTEICFPLNWRTKNHLGSMYFGILSMGADCAGGFAAMTQIQSSGKKVHLSFKNFQADFLLRAEADTHFINEQGHEISQFVAQVINNPGQRMNKELDIIAKCPRISDEIVANFKITLSLKFKQD